MPIIFILLLMWAASISSCTLQNADAMTIVENNAHTQQEKIDFGVRDEIKAWICKQIDCPDHISVDQIKLDGAQVAEVHATIHYNF